jgi:Pyruvate/2-oxoacid:ferredoxin oxidoreductase delta subunit
VKKTPRILYCHCANAQILPAETRRRVLEALEASGAAVERVADLCELAARGDESLKRFAKGGEVQVVACHERAVRWLFAAAGAPLPAEAAILNMRSQEVDAILARLAADVSATPAMSVTANSGIAPKGCLSERSEESRRAIDDKHTQQDSSPPPAGAQNDSDLKHPGDWIPWFPVIDYDRCKNCRQCLQFCLFGVYGTDEGGLVRVAKPEKCKTNCPACARICPHTAIIFPKFAEGGPISGDPTPPPKDAAPPIDFSSLAGLDLHEALKRRSALLAQRQKEGRR